MFCDRCGKALAEQSAFCPNCGRAFTPLVPAQGRIAGHVRLLGILWLALSAFRLLPGLVLLAVSGMDARIFPPDVPGFVHALLPVLGAVFLFSGFIGILAGWGLLQKQPWARMLAIVFGALNLMDLPFGTALGIYTLWVLLPAESEREYRATAQAA
jgi:hypothetical protein